MYIIREMMICRGRGKIHGDEKSEDTRGRTPTRDHGGPGCCRVSIIPLLYFKS